MVHYYHMTDRSDLRSCIRTSENALQHTTEVPTQAFYELIRERYSSILQYQRVPAFSGQISRTLSQLVMTEVYLFTLGNGDNSHIPLLVRQLQSEKIRVHMRIKDSTRLGKPAKKDYSVNTREARS